MSAPLYRAFTVFLLFACIVRFPQRPSCPNLRLRGLYCLCSMPASPVGLDPTCPPRLQALCRLSYFLFVSSVFRKDPPVRNSVSEVFTIFVPRQHHHQPENRPVREPVSAPRRFSCRPFVPSLYSVAFALFSVFNFPCPVFSSLLQNANYFFLRFPFSLFFPSSLIVQKNYPVRITFTWPLPSFLRFACIVRFLQRPFCPKFPLSGLYNLCPLPALPSARKPTCPKTHLSSAPFFLPISCYISIFCRFRVVFCFKFQALFSSLLRNCRLFLSPLPLFAFLSLFSHCPKKLSCPYRLYKSFAVFFYFSLVSSVFCKDPPVRNSIFQVFTTFVPCLHFLSVLNRFVCPALQGLCRLSYFSLASFAFRKGYPVRNSVSEVFTILIPFLHHHQPENRPVRKPISVPHRFSCRSLATSLFSVAFALFSVFSLQVLFLFDLTLFFFSRLVLFPLRPCPCSSCLFPQALCIEKFPYPYLYK